MPRPPKLPRYVRRSRDKYQGWWMEDGIRYYSSPVFTAEEAHEIALSRRRSIKRPTGRLTLEHGMDIVRVDLRRTEARQQTLDWYEKKFGTLLRAWEPTMILDEFTRAEVEWFIERRQAHDIGASTIHADIRALSRIFVLAMPDDPNPCTGVRKPKRRAPKPSVFQWTDALDVVATVAEASTEDADVMRLALYSGARKGELASMTGASLSGQRIEMSGKRGDRDIPAPPQLVELANRVCPLPGQTQGRREDYVRRAFARWQSRLEEPRLKPHAFRHTFASELVRLGVSLPVVEDLLGHNRKATSITQLYVTVFGEEHVAAMAKLWG